MTENTFIEIQSHQNVMKSRQQAQVTLPYGTCQDPPLNGTGRKRRLDLVATHTNVWHSSLRVYEKHSKIQCDIFLDPQNNKKPKHSVLFTIFHTEGTGVIEPFNFVLAQEVSFPRVTKSCWCSLHDPLRGLHVIRQDHVVVPTQT